MTLRHLFDGASDAAPAPAQPGPGGTGAADPAPAPAPAAAPASSILSREAPTADPTPTPAPEGAWYAGLSEELANSSVVQKHREGGVEGVVRALMSAETMLGRSADSLLPIPDRLDQLDHVMPVMKRLGLPENADAYKFQAVEGVPESLGPDQPLSRELAAAAHAAGVLPAQAAAMYSHMAKAIGAGLQQEQQDDSNALEADRTALTKEWGPEDSDGFKLNVAKVNHVLNTLDPGLIDVLNQAGLGLNPTVCNALLKIEGFLGERPTSTENIPFNTSGVLPKAAALENARALLRKANAPDTEPGERLRLNAEAQRFYAMAESGVIEGGQAA